VSQRHHCQIIGLGVVPEHGVREPEVMVVVIGLFMCAAERSGHRFPTGVTLMLGAGRHTDDHDEHTHRHA
jgi:hypothetical protein